MATISKTRFALLVLKVVQVVQTLTPVLHVWADSILQAPILAPIASSPTAQTVTL